MRENVRINLNLNCITSLRHLQTYARTKMRLVELSMTNDVIYVFDLNSKLGIRHLLARVHGNVIPSTVADAESG